MNPKTKIILAEHQELFRKALVSLLKTNSELEVISEALNGRELIEQLKHMPVDIVLLDTDVTLLDSKTTLEIIHRRFPAVKVIMLSVESNPEVQSDFMSLGANSFLCKNCEVQTLFKAIYKVKTEGYFFDESTSKALLDAVLKDKQRLTLSPEIQFNERETEILKKICDGKTNKEIASNLHLSTSTIDFHKTKIYSKTRCNNVIGLLKYALRNGLVELT